MLLQTLVQLNILILATPALAGWSLLPLAQPGVVRAACVGSAKPDSRGSRAEDDAKRSQRIRTSAAGCPAAFRPRCQKARLLRFRPILPPPLAAVISFNPFPHATRAP